MLSVVSGNTPEARSRALDVLRRAAPDAAVLSVSVQGDADGGYPCVQPIVTSDDAQLQEELCRAATGDPAVIIRQDLEVIARRSPRPHVVLSLPENLDAAALLTSLWQPPMGRTPTAHHYDLAATSMGVDPGRFLSDLRRAHRSAPFLGPGRHAEPVTLAEAAARQVEAAGTLILGQGQDPADGRRQGVRALLGHLNPSATVLSGDSDDADALKALVTPDPRWAEADPAERLDPVLAPVRRHGVHHGVMSVLWRSRRPVHPERLADCLPGIMSGVVRSRGHLWLATRERDPSKPSRRVRPIASVGFNGGPLLDLPARKSCHGTRPYRRRHDPSWAFPPSFPAPGRGPRKNPARLLRIQVPSPGSLEIRGRSL